jgi:hypothetical protein
MTLDWWPGNPRPSNRQSSMGMSIPDTWNSSCGAVSAPLPPGLGKEIPQALASPASITSVVAANRFSTATSPSPHPQLMPLGRRETKAEKPHQEPSRIGGRIHCAVSLLQHSARRTRGTLCQCPLPLSAVAARQGRLTGWGRRTRLSQGPGRRPREGWQRRTRIYAGETRLSRA